MQASSLLFAAVLLILSTGAIQSGSSSSETTPNSRPAPWYDCSGKEPGNYEHPKDCTRFISCSPENTPAATEYDCGECSNIPEACTPQNRLVFNVTVQACLWTYETECGGGGGDDDDDDGLD